MDDAGHAMLYGLWTLDKKCLVGLTGSSDAEFLFRELRTWVGTVTPLLGAASLSNLLLLVVGIQCRFIIDNFLSKEVDTCIITKQSKQELHMYQF